VAFCFVGGVRVVKETFLSVLVCVLPLCYTASASGVIFVDANSPNEPGSGTYTDPFRRIQDAINDANNGDIIEIRPGVYSGAGNYDLEPNGLAITIRSTNPEDPNIVANTIIDPNKMGRGFYFHNGEDTNCIVSGLTITNGYSASIVSYAGNVYCFYSSPTFYNCIIKNGHAVDSGGGFFCDFANPRITNCVITGNSAELYGGGISCYESSPEIVGCVITGNTAIEDGGGLDMYGNPIIRNCIITDNRAANGGGIISYASGEISLINCTIVRNYATNFGGALYCRNGNVATIKNSILWANDANDVNCGPQIAVNSGSSISISYTDIQGGQEAVYDPCEVLDWGSGNINTDPCFTSFDVNGDPNLWDFHLQSEFGRWDPNIESWVNDSNTSRCIDAGDPNSDWTDEPWPNGKRINMGGFGGTSQASKYGNIADFDIDGVVNFDDFAELASKWLSEESCIVNLDGVGVVDYSDLEIFSDNWLWEKQ
jgi:hypothetical protein